MRALLETDTAPDGGLLITCSSHEARCKGALLASPWKPKRAVVFHYDDPNPHREANHVGMLQLLDKAGASHTSLEFSEADAVRGLRQNIRALRGVLESGADEHIVFDISVFTKRHLLMTLQWLDDEGCWDRLTAIYTEPGDYDVATFLPLSFGLRSFKQIPGFPACPNLSRPVHLVLFLGYEGDRALAVFEKVEPVEVTLVIADPPYRPEWVGRTERYNADLISLVGEDRVVRVDSIDPEETTKLLKGLFEGHKKGRGTAKVISPLGTKPQALGVYGYQRSCEDSPALVYASPLRHNHAFYSHGIGPTRILKRGWE